PKPTAAAATTAPWSASAVTWWVSDSTLMTSVQRSPTPWRHTPPTWTLTNSVPTTPAASDRMSGGAPHGVYHSSRDSMWSNDSTGARLSAVVLGPANSLASAVPTYSRSPVSKRHRARGPSTFTSVPEESETSLWSPTSTHCPEIAVIVCPASRTPPSSVRSPCSVPIKMLIDSVCPPTAPLCWWASVQSG